MRTIANSPLIKDSDGTRLNHNVKESAGHRS